MYLAVVGKCPIPSCEGDREGLPRVQHPRVKLPIVGSDSMRGIAFVSPDYRVSWLDGYISWLKVEIFYSHRPRLRSCLLLCRSGGHSY